jgi:hypothetical protein
MLNITYTTYRDEYHFNFTFNTNIEIIFAVKDCNILKFLSFIEDFFNKHNKLFSYFKEDINNLELYCNNVIFSISYNDINFEVEYNDDILKSLENFYEQFQMVKQPLKIDNIIKKELSEYINGHK